MILETAAIASAAKPLVKKFVKELITPKITQFADKCKLKYNELLIPKGEHFEEYLIRTYDKYSYVNVLAIPNSQFQLKDVYVTQNLVKGNRFESEGEATTINQLPTGLIIKYKKILITDTAGMGKSTIMKYMFVDLIDNCIKDVGIPIFIELNRLNKNRTILAEIQEELNSLSKEFDKDLLLDFIQKGGFIFFLDGYDEISIADRNEVTKDIQTFISKAGNKNLYVLTSRPEDSLASFGDFQSFKIQPLNKNEAFELLTKYDISRQKIISKELIKELKTGKYDSIDEYLVNPLLVSLLYIAYNYKAEIPLKKHQFYRQVYDALFNSHKLAQGQKPHEKRSGLDIDDFNRVLRYVGYECLISLGVQFDKDAILNSIKRAMIFCGNLKFGESDFLQDLMTSVPLFAKDGIEYKWAHKSLMEYFAARFIYCDAKENQDIILSDIYDSDDISKYINMLDLYYDIDPKGFSKNITLPFCESYLKFYDSCIVPSNINKELVNHRIALLFWGKFAFVLNSDREKHEYIDSFESNNTPNFQARKCRRRGVYKNIGLYLIYNLDFKVRDLLDLLFVKNIKIISTSSIPRPIEWHHIITDNFEQDKIYDVDMRIGDNNDKYAAINDMIYPGEWIDYQACKKEVERIKNEIENMKKFRKIPKHSTNS